MGTAAGAGPRHDLGAAIVVEVARGDEHAAPERRTVREESDQLDGDRADDLPDPNVRMRGVGERPYPGASQYGRLGDTRR
jgi:hypothetical protein